MQLSISEAYTVLNLLPRIGSIRVKRLLEHYATPVDILAAPASELAKFRGIGDKLAAVLAGWRRHADLEAEMRTVQQAGVQLISLGDPAYPSILKEIYDPPLCLYVRGNVDALNDEGLQQALAVVGTRPLSHYGPATAERLAGAAARAGLTIVSGLARGVDTAAHRATLASRGRTIAVLGGGLAQIYPPENVDLARAICENGAVISEQPMRFTADRRSLPMRNRIISGLCFATLVVEAAAKSGALITAQQALEQGRQVFAVPGRIDTPQAKGCHNLIRDGAKLVDSIDDILDELHFLPGFAPCRGSAETPSPAPAAPSLSAEEAALVGVLRRGERDVDSLVDALSQPVHAVLPLLTQLELKHLIRQLPGRRYELIHRPT